MSDKHTPKPERIDDAQVCVVWHPSDRAPAPELLRALNNKGMTLIDADDPHLAFSAACKVANTARRVVLVLDGRDSLPNVDAIIGALPRFSPRVLCWAHVPGANPPLVPLVQPVKLASPEPSVPTYPAKSPSAPAAKSDESKLRLVGDAAPAAPKLRQAMSARDVLDADELDALLAGEAGDRKN
ncbi:MAG: hypothetical protein R3B67_13540 [Phycisphaerales bacterium]